MSPISTLAAAFLRHVHQPQARERRRVHPRAVHQHRVSHVTARRFQVQAALHRHRPHAVAERLHLRRQLLRFPPRCCAPYAHVQRLPGAHHVAAIQGRRLAHPAQRTVALQCARQRFRFPAPRFGARCASSPRPRPARSPGPPRTPRPDTPVPPAARSPRRPIPRRHASYARCCSRARAISIGSPLQERQLARVHRRAHRPRDRRQHLLHSTRTWAILPLKDLWETRHSCRARWTC